RWQRLEFILLTDRNILFLIRIALFCIHKTL
ncbi:MAG: hypothetical protein ACI957_005956, partial [Verrucomicrobiales bacterium]